MVLSGKSSLKTVEHRYLEIKGNTESESYLPKVIWGPGKESGLP